MRSNRSRVVRLRIVATAAISIAISTTLGASIAAPPAGAATRTLVALPASSLTNQAVQVVWGGFTPTTSSGLNQVIIVQCKGNPTSLADCFTAAPFPNSANGNEIVNGTTRADGTGTARIEIRPAAQLPTLGCNQAHPCSVLAYENQVVAPGKLPTLSALAPITFERSTADCPPVRNFDVRAEGEASAAPVVYGWAAQRCTGSNPLVVDFTETSSNSARSDFLHRLVDVGVTSLPAAPAELTSAPNYPQFSYAPVDLTALAVVYNMNDPVTNQPITDLVLTPRLLARVIADTDLASFFQDPEFRRYNPRHTWPVNGASTPLIRAERNADTWITTDWIATDKRAAAFLHGKDSYGVPVNPSYQDVAYPTDIFENRALDDAYLPRQGQYQVATHVFYSTRPADTSPLDPASVGFLGLVDLASANRFGLPTAKLVNAAGWPIGPTLEGVVAGYHAMLPGPDGTLHANFATSSPAAYPLVKVDYAMVPKQTDPIRRAHLRDLLTWGATEGQKTLAAGFVPLPSELADHTRQIAAGIAVPPTNVPPTTTSTVPSVTTIPIDTSGQPTGGSCCSAAGSALGGGATALAAAPGASQPIKTKAPARSQAGSPSGSAPATDPILPSAIIAAAAAPFGLPVILASGALAALVVLLRRSWPRLARSREALTRLLVPTKPRGRPSGLT